jgi:YVTN family beta-propeller protein
MGFPKILGLSLLFLMMILVLPVSFAHGTTNTVVASIVVAGSPDGVITDSNTGNIYVTDSVSGNVTVISGSTNRVITTVRIGSASGGGAFDPSNGEVYVPNVFSNTVSVINDSSNRVIATIPVGIEPVRATFDPRNRNVYVADYGQNAISVIADSSNTVINTIGVGANPAGLVFDPRNDDIYVAHFGSTTVSIIDGSTATVIATLFVGSQPDGIALDSVDGNIYVTNYASNTVSIISDATNSVLATLQVGTSPEYVAYSAKTCSLYATNRFSNAVSVISGATLKVVDTIPVGANPRGDAFSSTNGDVYVANNGDGTVSIISGQSLCPSLNVSPRSGPIGTKVRVQVSGFPASNVGPGQVIMNFDDMLLGIATNTSGNFSFTFNVPDAQPGLHLVKAIDEFTGTSVAANFTVTRVDTLSINVDVGTLYFPGDAATIYTLATLSGTPLNSSTLQLRLTLTTPDGSNVTLSNVFVGGGLFKATYTVPKAGPIGTYAIVAKAHVANVQDASALTAFEVKPTWLSAQGSGLTATALALTGVVAVTALVWRKGVFRTKSTDG